MSINSLQNFLQAILVTEVLGTKLEISFGASLGQSLCYALGELFMVQTEANFSLDCDHYAR